jgi:hypothetical protein
VRDETDLKRYRFQYLKQSQGGNVAERIVQIFEKVNICHRHLAMDIVTPEIKSGLANLPCNASIKKLTRFRASLFIFDNRCVD